MSYRYGAKARYINRILMRWKVSSKFIGVAWLLCSRSYVRVRRFARGQRFHYACTYTYHAHVPRYGFTIAITHSGIERKRSHWKIYGVLEDLGAPDSNAESRPNPAGIFHRRGLARSPIFRESRKNKIKIVRYSNVLEHRQRLYRAIRKFENRYRKMYAKFL